jgi:hypothetical protein
MCTVPNDRSRYSHLAVVLCAGYIRIFWMYNTEQPMNGTEYLQCVCILQLLLTPQVLMKC